ncbi:putative outer membrane protein [Escherichia coli]|uniref:Putative outer membrane protein n=1 Tax=Escherichia coli TaxID=562 RepID=A0A377BPQ3_ECOLX|nr:putative outer membrane protein [Escherichia coli]
MFIKALRADGQPLMFGYEVNDIHGHNIGVVGQGSQLFIRTNEVPPSVNVAIDKQQGLSCTITFVKRLMKVEIIFASNSQVVLWKFA